MKQRAELAEQLFLEGYNCSQSVFAAFSELYGIDRDTALKLSASFGGGFGRMREVCGAISGMCMVVGLETGTASSYDQEGKKYNYEIVQKLSKEFKEISGSIICRELLGLDRKEAVNAAPEKRTEEYYKKRPCVQLVKDAADIIEKVLFELEFIPVKTDSQIEEVKKLAEDIWIEHYTSIIGREQVEYMLENFQSKEAMKKQIDEGYHYYLLSSPGGFAGYFAYQVEVDSLFLSKLYIAKKYRGRNYAKKVIDYLENICREAELLKIWLTVNINNTSSIAAYECLGLKKARALVTEIGAGYIMDDYVMEKIINEGSI